MKKLPRTIRARVPKKPSSPLVYAKALDDLQAIQFKQEFNKSPRAFLTEHNGKLWKLDAHFVCIDKRLLSSDKRIPLADALIRKIINVHWPRFYKTKSISIDRLNLDADSFFLTKVMGFSGKETAKLIHPEIKSFNSRSAISKKVGRFKREMKRLLSAVGCKCSSDKHAWTKEHFGRITNSPSPCLSSLPSTTPHNQRELIMRMEKRLLALRRKIKKSAKPS